MFDWTKPTVQLLGRWQPWHRGHLELFKRAITKTGQVVIQVRKMLEDSSDVNNDENPFDYIDVCSHIETALSSEGYLRGREYEIMQVPNIVNITYGRDVGYLCEHERFDGVIEQISATKIRKQYRNNADLKANMLSKNKKSVVKMSTELQSLINHYRKTWRLLLAYDNDSLELPTTINGKMDVLDYSVACEAITKLQENLSDYDESTPLFGKERENSFKGILDNIEQTFFGEPLYQNHIVRAAHILYFIIKDHPFSDGNKRIGCLIFLLYLQRQNIALILNPEAMTALVLMIASSDPEHKNEVIRLICHLLRVDETDG